MQQAFIVLFKDTGQFGHGLYHLGKIFDGLGVEIYGEVGEEFDPELHNAVMHNEDESLGENVISMVFQKGFKLGDKIVRFAMVQVAN